MRDLARHGRLRPGGRRQLHGHRRRRRRGATRAGGGRVGRRGGRAPQDNCGEQARHATHPE
ncbi:Hypothetical protein CAP_8766 [Chondromyces apiculatus DSM 436]|uniref:Uncharacterized protein n=1 Tax=Chondromyces apiculatus DSM 436 TaxID=1192034 RepID=A0A017SVS1_9BACT|nr:Hypothetical protein CAP_8766 [Chondromyces apiculatus DSM 436]